MTILCPAVSVCDNIKVLYFSLSLHSLTVAQITMSQWQARRSPSEENVEPVKSQTQTTLD